MSSWSMDSVIPWRPITLSILCYELSPFDLEKFEFHCVSNTTADILGSDIAYVNVISKYGDIPLRPITLSSNLFELSPFIKQNL